MSDMTYAEAAEVLRRDDVSPSARAEAIEVALRALEDVEIQARWIIRLNQDIKAMRKAMNGQSEYAYLGGDLISREALIERMENVDWYSTNDKGVLHIGAACQKDAYVRWADVVEVMENALAVESEPVVRAHWVPCGQQIYGGWNRYNHYCSHCGVRGHTDFKRCRDCGAHMDEIRTCYCPICDKHFSVRSNDGGGSCPDCGHHVVLHGEEVE